MLKKIFPFIGLLLLCPKITFSQDQFWTSNRPDGHAPIGVMLDHTHQKGELMLSYRNMTMRMEGNLKKRTKISDVELFDQYNISPQNMRMEMHMLGIMYAPSDKITFALMSNYLNNSMILKTKMGQEFTTESSGLGDINISGIIKLMNRNRKSLHLNIGMSLPTGSIDQRDDTPMMENASLAYPMQLGSGTVDPLFGITYLGQTNILSWGVQSNYRFRIGENKENYRFGNRLEATSWGGIKFSDYLSFSTRLSFVNIDDILGLDADLNPNMMPLFDANNSGRSQLDIGFGTNVFIPKEALENFRLGAEYILPAYQYVNGFQMNRSHQITFGIQYTIE